MTLSFAEAQQRISDAVRALAESESRPLADCPLADSLGAVLATDLIAPKDVPSSDCAAVDGYGFCHATLPPDHCLQISGQVQAGHPLPHPFKAGSAIAITTGATIPQAENPQHSPDTIAMHEDCEVIKDKVRLPANIKKGSNFRPKGENIQKGETALKQGTQLGAAEIGLCAAMGFAKLSVMRALRVGVLSTGDELCDVADAPDAHPNGLIDSNRPMLMALLKADRHHSTDGGIIKDDRTATSQNLKNLASKNDAVLVSGGSAGGSEDHTRQAIRHAGGSIHFAGINIKPGRPFAMGQIGTCPIFCLPGNPVAVFVTYRLLVADALTRLSGAHPRPLLRLPVRCGFSTTHKQGRTDFVRVVLRDSDSDSGLPIAIPPIAIPHGRFGAGVLTSLTGADGLLEISADKGHIKEGDECAFIPLR